MTKAARAVALAFVPLTSLAGCAPASDGDARAAREAIVGGEPVSAPDAPVLYLMGPEGACSAVLVAPNLAATTRHCVATTASGSFSCTPSGDLMPNSTNAGQIGSDDPPGSLAFYTAASVAAGLAGSNRMDASGTAIVSTQTTTACKDDLAFVVLDRAIPGLTPAPLRLSRPTTLGESMSVSGFGLTDQVSSLALRTHDDVPVLGVGPDQPSTLTQQAPVRSVRIGPVTCQGDSGGPISSEATGALVALVSLGSQVGSEGPFCDPNSLSDTIGPRIAEYASVVYAAFQAAGATPTLESDAPGADAAANDAMPNEAAAYEASTALDSGGDDGAAPDGDGPTSNDAPSSFHIPVHTTTYSVAGGSCGVGASTGGAPGTGGGLIAIALTAAAVGRRRR